MVLKEFPPGIATRGTVRVYRVVHFAAASAGGAVKVYPPAPEQCLQLFLREPEVAEYPDGRRHRWNCVIAGAHDLTVRRHVPAPFLMIQAVFEPGALLRLTGIPGSELRNAYVDAESVLGGTVERLRQRLGDATSYAAMIAVIDQFIATLAARGLAAPRLQPVLQRIRDQGRMSIEAAAAHCALSLRQFERLCRQQTGLAPRELTSLARFDRAFHIKMHRPDLDWLSIAVACGYYDYQHMAREFRLYSGLTPARLLDTQRSSPEHQLGVRHEFDLSYGAALSAH